MKSLKYLALAAMGIWLAASVALAQTNTTSSQPKVEGQVVLPERLTTGDSVVSATANTRPARPERGNLPAPVVSPIERFKQEARAYLAREEELKKKMEGANDKDRAAIRDRIKVLREQWAERARELRKEFKERRDELSTRMPDRQELFNSINGNTAQPLQGGHTRPRSDP